VKCVADPESRAGFLFWSITVRWTERQLTSHLKRTGVPGAEPHVDVSDPPFALPPDIVLDLPPPLSVNRLWRSQKSDAARITVRKSGPYKDWIKRADDLLLELGQLKGVRPIAGKFTALLIVRKSAVDLDNNAKCVLDYLESRNFILNDALCQEITLRWGDAPTGCRVTVRACS
jgi:Holliday junction resolvase RusA-like endonuclease